MFNLNKKLARKKLIEITDEFIKKIKQFEIFEIPDKMYLDYFKEIENTFDNCVFENDKRFVTYGRLDFLHKELIERLNDEKLSKPSPNWKDKWDNRLGAFWDLSDYIRGDRHITLSSIPKGKNFKDVLIANDQYYDDGLICKEEKEVLLSMINEMKSFILNTQNNKSKIDDTKQLIMKIENQNWGQHLISEWSTKIWYLFNDLSIDYEVINGQKKSKMYSHNINDEKLKEIINNLDLAKLDNQFIDACDGEAWEFTQYENDKVIWKRDLGYIYGIEPLEKISYILLDLVKNDSDIFIEEEGEENDMGLFNKKNKYDIDEKDNRPQIVYGIPDSLRKQWEKEAKEEEKAKKYDINPEDNMPQEVYGIPDSLKKELGKEAKESEEKNKKYDVNPEDNVPQKVYGVPNSMLNDKESINIAINNYCLSLIKWKNSCNLLYVDKNKESFIKDSIITIPLIKFDDFTEKLNKIIVFWNNEYSGNNNITWQIKINTKNSNKNINGKGAFPHNWNEFIDLISEYEILFKKTIAYDKTNEEKEKLNDSFEKVVEEKVKDPFFVRLICEYFKNEINKSDAVLKVLFKDVSKYDDIFNEFTKYLVQKTYDLPNPISVEGYTAKQISELKPDFKATGVYTFLNYLREKPDEAKDVIKKGFPNKDVILPNVKSNYLLKLSHLPFQGAYGTRVELEKQKKEPIITYYDPRMKKIMMDKIIVIVDEINEDNVKLTIPYQEGIIGNIDNYREKKENIITLKLNESYRLRLDVYDAMESWEITLVDKKEDNSDEVKKYLKEIEPEVDEMLIKQGLLKIENDKKIPVFGSIQVRWKIEKQLLKERYNIDWLTPAERNPHINYD